jgi:DNA-binding response OmpR family regulator
MADATREIPIIVLSGRVLNVAKATGEALEAGADLLLLKPCAPTELVARARALIARSAQLKARADAAMAKATLLVEQIEDRILRNEQQLKRPD